MTIKILATKLINGTGIVFVLIRDIVIIGVLGLICHYYIYSIYPVQGESMSPNLNPGNLVGVSKINKTKNLVRGQIVILKFPADKNSSILVKRVVGLPGEKISVTQNEVKINDEILKEDYIKSHEYEFLFEELKIEKELAYNEYFIMGDNRENSSDSRTFGPVQEKDILGKVKMIFWPFNEFRIIAQTYY